MNEEILIELGVVSDETKGSFSLDRMEILAGCNFIDQLLVGC